MSGRRVAVLHDSPDFGGHERAFLTWLPALLAADQIQSVDFWISDVNARFAEAVEVFDSPKVTITRHPFVKGPAEPLRAPLRVAFGRAAKAFVKAQRADVALLLQGRIENLATPLLWLDRSAEVVSYVPMAHSGVELGRSAASAALTDGLKRFYYRRPARFIVPSHAVAAQARRAGAVAPIHVVENVPLQVAAAVDRHQARSELGVQPDVRLALFMGRFDTHQKGLDHLIRDLRAGAARLGGWRFLFVGQGPAMGELQAVLAEGSIQGDVVEWTDRPNLYLRAADLLLLPSRFEGVPLIMLEALQAGLPILASDIDVYRDYLPAFARRDFSLPVDLAAALDDLVSDSGRVAFAAHCVGLLHRLDLATSQQRFLAAVLGDEPDRAGSTSPARETDAR